jgi:c-di-GMP-binding flagellar brake protein YcgR
MTMITDTELTALLETLARDSRVTVGFGDSNRRGWFRAQVVSHDAVAGQLVLTCFMDRTSDRALEEGERVVVAAMRNDDELQSAPMDVEHSSAGPEATVHLRMAGAWQPADERRNQVRVPLNLRATRARRWAVGAWRDLDATLVDLSSRGVGVILDQQVQLGDRVSLSLPLGDGQPDLRVTFEVRHVRPEAKVAHTWRAGGLFRTLTPADHERVLRFIYAELRSRQ